MSQPICWRHNSRLRGRVGFNNSKGRGEDVADYDSKNLLMHETAGKRIILQPSLTTHTIKGYVGILSPDF